MNDNFSRAEINGGNNSSANKLTVQDFEVYAPKALAIADMHGEGVATKAEIEHMVQAPLPNEDVKTQAAMKFLAEHYSFLTKLSEGVEVVYGKDTNMLPVVGSDENLIATKYGITPAALDKVTGLLEQKTPPTYDQVKSQDDRFMSSCIGFVGALIPGAPIVGAATVGAIEAAGIEGTMYGLALMGGLATGLLAVGAAGIYAGYRVGKYYDEKAFRTQTMKEYSNFLTDIDGSEAARHKYFD